MARLAPIHQKAKLCSLHRCRRSPREQGPFFHLAGHEHWQGRWCAGLADAASALEQLDASDIFLQNPFLHLLEAHPPGLEGGLLLLYYRGRLAAAGFCQFLSFDAARQIRPEPDAPGRWPRLRKAVARHLRFEVLALGQFLVSGPHALIGAGHTAEDQLHPVLPAALEALAVYLGGQGRHIDGLMLKDLAPADSSTARDWLAAGFHQMPVQPAMVLHRREAWRETADYAAALESKYRVRLRRARKKAAHFRRSLLMAEEIRVRREEFVRLYSALAGEAGFNAVQLPPDYFYQLRLALGDACSVWGYFDGDELVGFYTAIHNGAELEAHYLGFEPEVNRQTQLYLNMLYDLVEAGITSGAGRIAFGRTALEIKSSVGAEPVHYFCGLRSRRPWLNPVVPLMAPWLSPLPRWEPRSPFRVEEWTRDKGTGDCGTGIAGE